MKVTLKHKKWNLEFFRFECRNEKKRNDKAWGVELGSIIQLLDS